LVLFPREILAIFGPAFPIAAAVTIVLALGKTIDVATGPCAMMLNMSGRPALNMADNVAALVLNVGLNLWLIPRYGIIGSAVAWAAALGVVNLGRLFQVRWKMGMWPFSREMGSALIAAAGVAVVGAAVRLWLTGPLELVVGVATVLAVYLGLMWAVGLTSDDRALLSYLRGSARPSRLLSG
jgi:O-antigen/teichoic acid export membrane protein